MSPLARTLWLAAASPTLLLGAAALWSLAGGPAFPFAPYPALLLWVLLSAPLALVASAARSDGGARSSEPEIRAAIEVVARAEQLAASQAAIVQELAARTASSPSRASRSRAPLVAVGVVLVLVLAGGGAWAALTQLPAPANPVHIHAAFAIFDGESRLGFTDPYYDVSQRGFLRGHLHAPDQDVLHVEGPAGATLAEIFAGGLDATLGPEGLSLRGPIHGDVSLAPSSSLVWRLRVAHDGSDDWRDEASPWSYAPRDHDRLLLVRAAPDAPLDAREHTVARSFPAS